MRHRYEAHTDERPVRALVIHPMDRPVARRAATAMLDEAVGLAKAIDLDVVDAMTLPLPAPSPATLIGRGSVERLAQDVKRQAIDLVVVDTALTPVQQRNLERAVQAKVIDRTGLILEIFGERAHSREGKLQVELAALSFQRSRLVRSWTHLGRQRGGYGFLGGPGESQLEVDRRQIKARIDRLKSELDAVRRTRELHRRARARAAYPTVALVGYTNTGKSSLFNMLTSAEVPVEDMLFATLDPTMRACRLPSGRRVILSDTVGFVANLPHQLVAAFNATLEEVQTADVIIHVRDISHADTAAQKADVEEVLASLKIDPQGDPRLIEALNKIDLMPAGADAQMRADARGIPVVAISARTGVGVSDLLDLIDRRISLGRDVVELDVDLADGATLSWLYQEGEVLDRQDDENEAHLLVAIDRALLMRRGEHHAP